MEVPGWLFISFWAVISFTSLHLGFYTLEKTKLSHSLPALVMFFFRHSLAVSSCFSSIYALKLRAQSVRRNFALLKYLVFSNILPQKIDEMFTSAWSSVKSVYIHWNSMSILGKILLFLYIVFAGTILLLVSITGFLFFIIISLLICSISFSAVAVVFFICFACFLTVVYGVVSLVWMRTIDWVTLFIALRPLFLVIYTHIVLALCCMFFCCLIIIGIAENNWHFVELKTRAGILLALEMSLFFVRAKSNFSPIFALPVSHFIAVCWASFSRFGDHNLDLPLHGEGAVLVHGATRFVALTMNKVVSKLLESKVKKFIEFAVGTLGALLFQNFFTVTSFDEVVAFLSFAMTCLANQMLLGFCGDFGVFKFMLTNAVVGCTVGHFGLHRATWLAFGIVLLLFALHLILKSVPIAYEEDERIQLSFSDFMTNQLLHRITCICRVRFLCLLPMILMFYTLYFIVLYYIFSSGYLQFD